MILVLQVAAGKSYRSLFLFCQCERITYGISKIYSLFLYRCILFAETSVFWQFCKWSALCLAKTSFPAFKRYCKIKDSHHVHTHAHKLTLGPTFDSPVKGFHLCKYKLMNNH